MKIFIFIISLLIIKNANGNVNVNTIQDKLWSNIEHQLEELTKKLESQKTKINGFKSLMRGEGINYTHFPALNDDDENDPFAFAITSTIKSEFQLLKDFRTETKSFDITPEDKNDIKQSVLQNYNKLNSIETRVEALQTTLQSNLNGLQSEHPHQLSYAYVLGHRSNNEHCTLNQVVYKIFSITGNEFRFKIRASSNGHVALLPGPSEANPIYEVVLSGWTNTHSSIRKDRNQDVVKVPNEGLMDPCNYLGFWVRWDGGEIKVGYEGKSTAFLKHKPSNMFRINYVGIHSYHDTANWIINSF